MIEAAVLLLIVLFLLGYVSIPGVTIPNYHIFTFNQHTVTLYEILIFIVAFGILVFLPRFLRFIVGALLIIWVLSSFGFIVIKGLPIITIVVLLLVVVSHRSFHWYHHYRRRYEE